ncbi:MAG: hypothetical protein IPG02_02455 [Ignavibacteria bacterium]|mgnify:CR=1 FL=1|nr:hypothetical protein [Ignavibacteria bacterium]
MSHKLRENLVFPVRVNPIDVVCGFFVCGSVLHHCIECNLLNANTILLQCLSNFWPVVLQQNPHLEVLCVFSQSRNTSDELKSAISALTNKGKYRENSIVAISKNLSLKVPFPIENESVFLGFCFKSQNPEIILLEKGNDVIVQ